MTQNNDQLLKFGLPKGRMFGGIRDLLADAGIKIRGAERGYRPSVSLEGVSAKILKPQSILEMISSGSRDLGFAGADWRAELALDHSDAGIVEVLDTGLDPVSLVAAAPSGLLADGQLPKGTYRVAAEMVGLTQRWIDDRGLDASVVRTYGATEVFPPEDADLIVDISASGATLRANGLEVFDELLTSSTRLYASQRAMDDPKKRTMIDGIALLVGSVLEARQRMMIELNVSADQLDRVTESLPCMREPTVSQLRGGGGYAVRAAVPNDSISTLIPELKLRGATDIVVSAPSQIVR